jgi:hypothetical protein
MRTHLALCAPPTAVGDTQTGKFLQLVWCGDEYLVFAPAATFRFHNQILARFLSEHGVDHRWRDEETLEFDTDRIEIGGGGRFRVDASTRTLELWDNSQAYGRFAASGLAGRIAAAGHAWSGYRVDIR